MTGEANIAARIVREPAVSSAGYQPSSARRHAFLAACAIFMMLSGFSALVYQVTWVRLLGLGLGSTSASISIVVSSFFLGMSLGSYFFERALRGGRDGMTAYATLELCISASGLILLPILLNLDYVLSFAPMFGTQPVLKLVATLFLLIVPTTCMGATFPVMTSVLAGEDRKLGRLISSLYSLNTFGAVLGAALCGFVLIPNLGLDGSIYLAVTVNLAIGVAAFALARPLYLATRTPVAEADGAEASRPSDARPEPWHKAAAITLAITGFASIATQVGWTKYLAIFVGSTIFGLSVILAVFLTGIALGAWLIRRRIDTVRSPEMMMALGLAGAAVTMLVARAGLAYVPELQAFLNRANVTPGVTTAIRYGALVLLMLPPTLIFGALFPLNLKSFCSGLTGVRTLIGKAYAVNTLASIAGAAFAGFVAIPMFGTDILLGAMAVLVAATALIWFDYAVSIASRMLLVASSAAAALLVLLLPGLDYERLIANVGYDYQSKAGETPDYLFLKEGKAGVISLLTYDGNNLKLQNNGLNEAGLTQGDPNDIPLMEAFLGFIPYALHSEPRSAFVVGFGGGTTTRILADTELDEIRVVELEPAVVEAGHFVKGGPVSALSDPRVAISYNDARNVLVVEDQKYDIIVSQPSHPWLAGSAGLFSQEFWQITKSRLNNGGVFAQWVNLFRMDVPTMQSLFKAFFEVYPHGMVFADAADSEDMLMIGSAEPLTIDHKRFNALLSKPVLKAKFAARGIRDVNDVLWYFALSRSQAVENSRDAVASRDANVLSEVRLSGLTYNVSGELSPKTFMRRHASMDVTRYLGSDAEAKLTLLSMHFLREKAYYRARLAIDQLAKLNPPTARVLAHRRALERLDFAGATMLYRKHPDWPGEAHLAQARAMADIGAYAEARAALAAAGDTTNAKREAERLNFLEGVPPDLAAPFSSDDSEWLLMARAEAGDAAAGERLVSWAQGRTDLPAETAVYLNRALAHRFAMLREEKRLQAAAMALAEESREFGKKLAKIADRALDAKHAHFAALAVEQIESLGNTPKGLAKIKRRLGELGS
jgi:spermidine synthase